MKKSSAKWIALGTLLVGAVSFAAGMAYQFNQLAKIQPESLSPDEDEETSDESEE